MKHSLSFYKKIFATTTTGMVICDESGQCIEANEAIGRIIGGTREDVLSQNYHYMKSWEGTDILKTILYAAETNKNQHLEVSLTTSLGRHVSLDFKILPFVDEEQQYLLVVIHDITELKQAENELRHYHIHLEELVSDRTYELKQQKKHLEEANVTLKVLLEQREKDKKEIEKNIFSNVEKLVFPYLDKAKGVISDSGVKIYLDIIESNLKEITAQFAHDLLGQHSKLTPTEIQVADLIRKGKSTKEIAQFLNLSLATIATHRQNIRKKLELTDKKMNLRTALTPNQR
jgi:PAS domain S-box-containing protein